jgi:hypothetical protein
VKNNTLAIHSAQPEPVAGSAHPELVEGELVEGLNRHLLLVRAK